jgi:hypothetical protein
MTSEACPRQAIIVVTSENVIKVEGAVCVGRLSIQFYTNIDAVHTTVQCTGYFKECIPWHVSIFSAIRQKTKHFCDGLCHAVRCGATNFSDVKKLIIGSTYTLQAI